MGYRGWENYAPLSREDMKARATNAKQKFNAKPTRGFRSKKEANRYDELKLRLKSGEITDLECQPEFVMHARTPEGELLKVGRYTSDFRYSVVRNPDEQTPYTDLIMIIVEEVKGGKATKTEAYQLRKRHVEAEYGIVIQEV